MNAASKTLVPPSAMRVALFSGNYNCVRDGANNALNRLVSHLLGEGAAVRVYSPTAPTPAFPPVGDLVSAPSIAIPGRPEYRLASGMNRKLLEDLQRFNPTLVHVSAPDILGFSAQKYAIRHRIPIVASLHTRFEKYLGYYKLNVLRNLVERQLDRFYRQSDCVLVPTEPIRREFRDRSMNANLRLWGRGIDPDIFNPKQRSLEWRRGQGWGDEEAVILFFGRLVKEKGVDLFADIIAPLRHHGSRVRPLIVGEGPARTALSKRLPNAVFAGHLEGSRLGTAVASADILVNPSTTEAFGNVNLEAMASGLAVVSADTDSARALIEPGKTGLLVSSVLPDAYRSAIAQLVVDKERREWLGAGAAHASLNYRWSQVLESVVVAYQAVLKGNPRPK